MAGFYAESSGKLELRFGVVRLALGVLESCTERDAMTSVVAQSRTEIEALCRRYAFHRLELFGSAAAGQDRPGESDLDFLVEFGPLPPGAYADAYFDLLESLEELFSRKVDLVVASAIRNPYFLQAIEPTKTLLYAA